MCILIIGFLADDVMNFEVDVSNFVKLFLYMTKNLRKKLKITQVNRITSTRNLPKEFLVLLYVMVIGENS